MLAQLQLAWELVQENSSGLVQSRVWENSVLAGLPSIAPPVLPAPQRERYQKQSRAAALFPAVRAVELVQVSRPAEKLDQKP